MLNSYLQAPVASANASSGSAKLGEVHPQLFAVVRDRLRDRILSGEFKPGDRLVEGRLSEEMGVSRIPVREALRALAAEGLVTVEPRRGASVAVLSEKMAYDMVAVRAALEGLNAKLAAQQRDEKTLAQLREFLREGELASREERIEAFQERNSQFHQLLATATGNEVLRDMLSVLRARTALLFAPSNIRRARQNWDEHAQILSAVLSGNGELASLLASQHVYNAAEAYAEAKAEGGGRPSHPRPDR
ncbi:GntR family transcriptional regulator [Pigmentiphaga sp.]|uniref:GntR family transcriptional regulator n=1 Tax=Pigmentiphaga sp. TaxID=1977564 RepID=UPI00128C275A|nr:GntR family transcriptional regulator [Pigmentiphaga sp.]MPS27311.1 GntR family transcriptional regulator [Alcaligenaceae bacterium SAGV5]MPS51549.1 GntR family transcriptional regulator [Alcaligenaceae bacterium SAGV3]MPT55526.1 GntR family transcriptional regulator [Alcaligenaceae bacterium]